MGIRVFSGGGGGGTAFTGGLLDTSLTFTPDNTIDVGSSALRPRSVYAGTSFIGPSHVTAAGVDLALSATAPAATTGASQAGKAATLTASAAVASTDTAGAAAGGSVTITAGAAARNTSGNANGGNIVLARPAGIGTGTAGQVLISGGDGALAAPALANASSTNTGLYFPGGNQWAMVANGTNNITGSSTSVAFPVQVTGNANFQTRDTGQFSWSSTSSGAGTQDVGFARQAAGVIRATNGSTGILGLLGGGTAVASATAMPLPTGRVFHVTGTTNITSITSTNFASGAVITLIFDGVLTFTDGSNLVLAGDFVTTANDTITLAFDGTNWYEVCRSVN